MSCETVGSSPTSLHADCKIASDGFEHIFQRMMNMDTCFNCKKQGHWARDCPNIPSGQDFPVVHCSCGAGPCVVLTSRTEKNPGRKFYSCPVTDKKCGFFKWCDMVRSDRRCDVPQSSYGAEVHIPTLKSRGNACIGEKVNSGSGYGRRIPESEPSPKKEELPDSRDQVRDYQSISQRDRCFHCLKQGHWAHECPNRTTKKIELSGGKPTIVDTAVYLNKQCPCGVGACLILTSNTEKNPGRKFYRCPGKAGRKCNFFQWCDLETADERHDALQSVYPLCSCGAGVCSLLTVKNGRNAGRKCFVCPVKRGQGACNFFQWQDAPAKATSTSHLDENKPCSSPNSASYCQNEAGGAMKDNHYNNLEENLTPGLAEEESSLFREFHSKIETDGSGIGIDDCYPPIERLDLE